MSPVSTSGDSNVSRNAERGKSFVPKGLRPFAASHQSGRPSPSVSPLGARGSVPARNSSRSLMPSPSASPEPSRERSPKRSISHSSGKQSPSEESPSGRLVETTISSTAPLPCISIAEMDGTVRRKANPSPTITPSTYRSHVCDE